MNLLKLKVVLVAVDTDEASLVTLRAAREFARAAGATLHIAHVTPVRASDHQTIHPGRAEAAETARTLLERAGVADGEATFHLLTGEMPAHEIRSLGDRIRADVIVLGRHRARPGSRGEIGSTALGVVTNSWAPCLILSRSMSLPLERVLVPVDLSDTSRGALLVALSWGSALRSQAKDGGSKSHEATTTLTALVVARAQESAAREPGGVPALDDELRRLREVAGRWAGVAIHGAVIAGSDVPEAIAGYAREYRPDLVVVGTRGLGLDAVGRLGSVSLGISRGSDVPLLLVPPAVWKAYGTTP